MLTKVKAFFSSAAFKLVVLLAIALTLAWFRISSLEARIEAQQEKLGQVEKALKASTEALDRLGSALEDQKKALSKVVSATTAINRILSDANLPELIKKDPGAAASVISSTVSSYQCLLWQASGGTGKDCSPAAKAGATKPE